MFASVLGLTGCNSLDDASSLSGGKLDLSFGVQQPASRAVITDDYLPSGSQVGVTLSGTDYADYANVCYTASGTGTSQSWAGSKDVLLTSSAATLYSYYPYSSTGSSDAIPVETASQTDYLYGTPVTGISEAKASTGVTLNHALANLKITVAKGSYAGVGAVSKISVAGAGIATGGTFNAAQTTPGYTAYSGEGSPVERTLTSSLGSPVDVMVVPTGASAAVTFTVTVDGTDYTATSSAVALQMGAAYAYTLTLNSSFLAVSSFGVAGWSTGTGGSMVLDKYVDKTIKVYAVNPDFSLVDYKTATTSAVGVAVVAGEHKFMIAESDATDGTDNKLYWGKNLGGIDIDNLTNQITINGTDSYGYLPLNDGAYCSTPHISADFTTWTSYVLSEMDGKANTAAIIAAYAANDVTMESLDMCAVLNTFNAATDGSNAGKHDWYIPACGQLAIMYLAKDDINAALNKIGGNALNNFAYSNYWSSSEYGMHQCWGIYFDSGETRAKKDSYNSSKFNTSYVRFIRDIE